MKPLLLLAVLCLAFTGCAAMFRGLAYDPSAPGSFEEQYAEYQKAVTRKK
ncbi:MAG: hypothetical protein HZC54_00690 [Verrucomicrobia bacterium]|nr:hypothetical protein [Verrucomicrobiota bacterium]